MFKSWKMSLQVLLNVNMKRNLKNMVEYRVNSMIILLKQITKD